MYQPFAIAKPVWETGKEKEMNYFLAFTARIPKGHAVLTLAASTIYSCFINGKFAFQGPARGPKGWYRVDEVELDRFLTQEENHLDIEVGGYNCSGFMYIMQPSFLQAELVHEGKILAATGITGFEAVHIGEKVQKTQRYSFQRVFSEAYRLDKSSFSFRTRRPAKEACVSLRIQEEKRLLPRGVKLLRYERADAAERVANGSVETGVKREKYWEDRALLNISPILTGFPKDQLEFIASQEVQETQIHFDDRTPVPYSAQEFAPDTGAIYAFSHNTAGMLGCHILCQSPATVYFVFDEILVDGDIQFMRADCASILKYELQPGEYDLLSYEPYVMKYVKVLVLGGTCQVRDLHIRQVICPDISRVPNTSKESLRKIYEAACETFRQNAVDIYMDCPSRERAGWLCDSFWTARVERHLTGESRIERNFLENFLLPEQFDNLPEGMFPMCYPSDHLNGEFIPNWAMWLVLELEEYLHRTGDREMIDRFRQKLYQLVAYFDRFTNSDGLLEKLESWVFLEWSDSNKYVQDLNYPSNMLYAMTLETIGRLYGDSALSQRGETMKQTIRTQSFNGRFFTDNAVRKDGRLVNEGHMTESCQYYAFFTGVATPETYPKLWETLVTDFGPQRKETHAYAEVSFANAFIGNYLRLECLWREGRKEQLLRELEGYFLFMAEKTGTLWEHDSVVASCDHGFASHVAVWIDGILG